MKKILIASLIGAVVLFLFGFVFWGVLPVTQSIFAGATNEAALGEAVRANLPSPGVYMIPGPEVYSDMEEFSRRHEAGPVAMIFVHPAGLPVMPPSMMVGGFLNNFVAILIMAVLLRRVSSALPTYGSRVAAVVLAALSMVVLADLGDPVWWRHTWSFYIAQAVYHTVGWFLVALVLAKVVDADVTSASSRPS